MESNNFTVNYPVAVNGKHIANVNAHKAADQDEVEDMAVANEKVRQAIGNKDVRSTVFVQGKMINFVV